MFSGLYEMGRTREGGGEVNNCTNFSGCHTIRLWGQKKKKVLNTHMH